MTSAALRQLILEGLERSNVFSMRRHRGRAAFLQGTGDVELDELDMDSLARMELCIYIEAHTGIELTPAELERIKTLEGLARELASR